jgi:hypothetical protein
MRRAGSALRLTRRRFAFWVGLGLFQLGEKLHADELDRWAAALMRGTDPADVLSTSPEHWTAATNRTWRWFERENLIDDRWVVTGITAPIHRQTGERYTGHTGYLDDSLVPDELRFGDSSLDATLVENEEDSAAEPGKPTAARRDRHGRPPSKWLRSLNADEIRIFLAKIEVPESGVSGMTFWEHLTRDHSFDPDRIVGLTEDEQAKLHSAAHYGY